MSELMADLFISVDGCAKGSRSPAYFGFGGPDLDRWIGDQMKRPQRHLMGRKTYEALAALPEPVHDEGSLSLAATPTTVFSRTLRVVSWPQATISGDLTGTVGRLKAGDTGLRTIGSLSLVSQLLGAGARRPPQAARLSADRRGDRAGAGVRPAARYRPRPSGAVRTRRRIVLSEYRPSGVPPYAS
jgi:dihydrofolate reductase